MVACCSDALSMRGKEKDGGEMMMMVVLPFFFLKNAAYGSCS